MDKQVSIKNNKVIVDTILKAFDNKPTEQEIENAKIECCKFLDINGIDNGETYLQYDKSINSWLLRIKTDDEPKLD